MGFSGLGILQAEVPQDGHGGHQGDAQDQSGAVGALEMELTHPGTALSAMVTAALHGHRQLIGPPEGGDEQGH